MRITQSKMNTDNVFGCKNYPEAFRYLRKLKLRKSYLFSEIPENISYAVIDILDKGFTVFHEVFFDQNFQTFKIEKNIKQ